MKRRPVILLLVIAILIVVLGRIQMVFIRFIDPDEFAYLHWTYLLSLGKVPYRDFFLYHIPLYQFLMIPIFFLPYSSFLIYLARVWELLIYGMTVFILARFAFYLIKSVRISLLTILIFIIFPMTLDKTVDLRPDVMMMFFFLGGLYLLWTQTLSKRNVVLAGLSFGLSIMTFPKIIFALPAVLYVLYIKHKSIFTDAKKFGILTLSATFPFLVFVVYLLVNGTVPLAIESITKGAWAVSAGKIPFSPWLALSPWPVIYVEKAGISLPWLVNTAVWILAVPGLCYLWNKNRNAALLFLLFFAGGIFFIYAFPAPYTQYFLPLSYFAAFLTAVTINTAAEYTDKIDHTQKLTLGIFSVVAVILVTSFIRQYRERIEQNNWEQMTVIDTILSISQPDETFYDMTGSYVFRPDGYSICCHPYAEFIYKLPHQPPPLRDSLVTNKTKFVVLDRTGQAFWKPLPQDLDFMFRHYVESPYKKIYTLGARFTCTNGTCSQININNQTIAAGINSFDIAVQENYLTETQPPNRQISINGSPVRNTPFMLHPGTYSFSVPPDVTYFLIRLAR